ILRKAPVQVGVIAADWSRFMSQFDSDVPAFLERLQMESTASKPAAPEADATSNLRTQLENTPRERRLEVLIRAIEAKATSVLGLDPRLVLDSDQPLRELGMDSLMAVELRK